MVADGQEFCLCEGFWGVWVFWFPCELGWSYTRKPQGWKKVKKERKAEAVPQQGRWRRAYALLGWRWEPMTDGQAWWTRGRWNHRPFQTARPGSLQRGAEAATEKGEEKTDYSVLRSQAMCLQKAWPPAAAKYSTQLGHQGNGQGKSLKQARGSPGKCRLVGLAFGFVGGK